MAADSVKPIIFGMAGLISLGDSDHPLEEEIPNIAANLRDTARSVIATWHGDQIAAISHQHSEDALMMPGTYHYRLPEIRSYQGIAQGHFFSSPKSVSEAYEQAPYGISRAITLGYAEHGLAAFADLNGAWVAVVFDKMQKRVILARDAVGLNTLYVAFNELQIVFASDLRLLGLSGIASDFDEQAILEFLHFLYVPSPRSVYKSVHSVLPGHALTIEHQQIRQERFAPSRFVPGISLGEEGKVQAALKAHLPSFRDRLLSAAESCVPRHGRIGLLLSAGKDSAALALALKDVAPDRVIALTVGSPDPQYDESDYAARMCKYLGIPHTVYTPRSDELIPGFSDMVVHQEQPMGDPASLPLFLSLGHLPDDVSVIWDGTGNDYYFGSVRGADKYRHHKKTQLMQIVPRPVWPLFLLLMRLGPERFASTARDWQTPIEEAFVSWRGWTKEELSRLWQRNVGWSETYIARLVHDYSAKGWTSLQTEVFGAVWTPGAAIRKTSYAAHAYGRALRMPLIDNRLMNLVNNLPQELQFQDNVNKILLRRYLSKYLPEDLAQRPKGSFVFDQNTLLQNRHGLLLKLLNSKGLLRILPSWSDSEIQKMLSAYTEDPQAYVDRVYALVLLALWIALARGQLDWDGL